MSTSASSVVNFDDFVPNFDDFVPNRLDLLRDRLGEILIGHAQRLRMLGERIQGARPPTDDEEFRLTYDWGHKPGRESALATLVGDDATKDIVRATRGGAR